MISLATIILFIIILKMLKFVGQDMMYKVFGSHQAYNDLSEETTKFAHFHDENENKML